MANPMEMMWIGPRGGEMWFKSPDAGGVFTPMGWNSDSAQFFNGGTNVRRSNTTHMDYPMAWSIQGREALSPLRDMYSGARGPGLIYFIDLMAADLNVLPEQWAFPAAACLDAIPIIGDDRPGVVPTPDNQYSNPVQSAQYDLSVTTAVSRKLYVPIPPGYSAWVGVKGSIDGTGGLAVLPVSGASQGTPLYPEMLDVSDETRVNTEISGASWRGIEISLDPSGTANNVVLTAMNVQILKQGFTPEAGSFIGGWGNSGCEFAAPPSITSYSSVLGMVGEPGSGQVGASAHLIETGDWQ